MRDFPSKHNTLPTLDKFQVDVFSVRILFNGYTIEIAPLTRYGKFQGPQEGELFFDGNTVIKTSGNKKLPEDVVKGLFDNSFSVDWRFV